MCVFCESIVNDLLIYVNTDDKVLWCGVVCCAVVCCGLLCCGMVWFGVAWYDVLCGGMWHSVM